MSEADFARTPAPPYVAVIFTSQHTGRADPAYQAAGEEMLALAQQQPGFLGIESASNPDGFGITVSYWATEDDARAWGANARHREIQARGRTEWYRSFTTRIARVDKQRQGP